ncbi:forkhead box protein N3-like [Osmerus mordax]|uniref:forkhead box protein N3-like n=1 Tax=Osmerus mordax TaxID=8014 RepID=UPI00350EB5F2
MAEATPRPCRFFCHRCSAEISPRLPDYTCPRCESGFIEELPEERSSENGSRASASSSDQNRPSFEFALGIFDENFDLRTGLPTEDNREAENRREREMASRQRYSARQPRGRHIPRRQGPRQEGVPTLEGIIQQLVNGIIAPTAMPNMGMGPWGMLHSNPMDYAWGVDGLDAIITQLLNQFENTGPPPADRERIKSLPTINITESHVGSGLECSVCKEDYSVGENVRQLPCNHLFHNDCIVPWLEQHDTCPVCRKSLSGQNTATDPPGLSGMTFSPSSSSPSPDPCDPSPYDLASGANRKPPYSFSCLIFMAIEDAPSKRLPVKDIYGWILEHFPYFASAPTGWKNSVRHNLSLNKCFKKVDKDRSQSIGKGSLWSIDPEYRHNLIQALKKTPYHPYSPGLVTPSTSPPTSPQAYHSPPLWPGNPFFRKNRGVLLQVPGGVIQNGARIRSQGLFPVIRPLPISPMGSKTSGIRSALGDYLTRGQSSAPDSVPPGDDLGEDHTYSSGLSPSMPCSSQGPSGAHGDEGDNVIAVDLRGVKSEPREVPVDSAFLSQQARRARATLPWTKNRLRALSDTLPLKKRRAAEKPPESDDEEMKEAAGSLLHLAGVRACLNNITNRNAKGQKEPKDALRD